MRKFFVLSVVLMSMLFFCACEKEMPQPDPQQEDVSAFKGADSNGLTQQNLTPFPMWARLASGAPYVIPSNDEYGVIIFYVTDPHIIPPDHNFYPDNFFAPMFWLIPEEDWAVEGTSWHQPDNFFPHHYKCEGKGDVILWIITFEQVLELLEGKSITIPELEALNPLVGHASMYKEVLRPGGGGAPVLGGEFNAHGTLEDGRRFIFNMHSKVKPGEPLKMKLKFEIIGK